MLYIFNVFIEDSPFHRQSFYVQNGTAINAGFWILPLFNYKQGIIQKIIILLYSAKGYP